MVLAYTVTHTEEMLYCFYSLPVNCPTVNYKLSNLVVRYIVLGEQSFTTAV